MRVAAFIPIKRHSERIPGKNFIPLNGKKLYRHICEHAKAAGCFDEIYIDTDSAEIMNYAATMGFHVIVRKPELALDTANGNDLLVYHFEQYPQYDFYFQLFVTAPYMRPETIRNCFEKLTSSAGYDSCFTAVKHQGFYWFANNPVNYRPGILPQSQELTPMVEETTGLYGIARDSLRRYRCRVGRVPYIHFVDKFEAVDINVPADIEWAEYVGNNWICRHRKGGKVQDMNHLEGRMLKSLKRLKNDFGAVAVKVEFESEGTRLAELLRLAELVFKADLKLFIKIGGCEALTDLNFCKLFGANAIVAPMIESPFALKKFTNAAQKIYGSELASVEWIINLETKTAHDNADSILEAGREFLSAVAIGRSDLAASMGLEKSAVNDNEIFAATTELISKAKAQGLTVGIGGNVTEEIIPFLLKMNLPPDRVETRKLVLNFDGNTERLSKAIAAALESEMLYLENNINLYSAYSDENYKRLTTLKERMNYDKMVKCGGVCIDSGLILSAPLMHIPLRAESEVAA